MQAFNVSGKLNQDKFKHDISGSLPKKAGNELNVTMKMTVFITGIILLNLNIPPSRFLK